jgi:hypothetical protein
MADVICNWNVYNCQPDFEVPTPSNLVRLIAECPCREHVVTLIVTDAIDLESATGPFDISEKSIISILNQRIIVRVYENRFSHDSNGSTNVNFMLIENRSVSTRNVMYQQAKKRWTMTMTFGVFRRQITRKGRVMFKIRKPALLLFYDAM